QSITEISTDFESLQTLDKRTENHCFSSLQSRHHRRRASSDPNTHLNGNLTELDTNQTSNLNPNDTGFLSGNAEICKPPLSVTKSRRRRS
ncbi:hypothetical protein HID58_068893, partial [Brassica napus]